MSLRLRKNDLVEIVSGEHRGLTGRILRVHPKKTTAVVEARNMIKRHTKPNQKNQQGGIIEREAPIHLSNLKLVCPKTNKPTRIGVRILEDGKRVRYSKKAQEMID